LASHSFCATAVPCFGSACVVFAAISKLDLLAADHDVLRVQLFNGHARAVFVVLAVVRLATRHGRDVTNLDHLRVLRGGHTGHTGDSSGYGQFQLQLHKKISK
jgi:hypothetical protein